MLYTMHKWAINSNLNYLSLYYKSMILTLHLDLQQTVGGVFVSPKCTYIEDGRKPLVAPCAVSACLTFFAFDRPSCMGFRVDKLVLLVSCVQVCVVCSGILKVHSELLQTQPRAKCVVTL